MFGPEGIDLVTSGFELAYEKDYQFRTEHHTVYYNKKQYAQRPGKASFVLIEVVA